MASLWTLLALFIPLLLLLHFLRGRPLGHGYLLAFGGFAYGVLPFYAFASGIFEGGPGDEIWSRSFEQLYRQSGTALLLASLGLVAYGLGSTAAAPFKRLRYFDRPINTSALKFALLALLTIWLIYMVQARELLFSGYLLAYQPELMGPLANVTLASLLIYLNLKQWEQKPWLLWAFGALIACNSVALLSMGGRLYVLAPLVAMALQHFNSIQGCKPKARFRGLLLLGAAVGLLALVGLWRLGGEIDAAAIGKILLAEPLLTSISLGTLMDCPAVDWFSVPHNYLSSIINFVPSAMLPNKEELLVDLDPNGNCLSSPFGATHLGTALLINFGILGTLLAITLFAFMMRVLRGGGHGSWLYYYLCSLLPFMLFRDGFLIFNKAFFATGLLFALVLMLTNARRQSNLRRRSARNSLNAGSSCQL